MNYWATLLATRPFQPTTTLLIKLVEALIKAEPEADKKHLAKVKWIYDNTHEKVNIPLSTVEFMVFRNWSKGANKELEINGKNFQLIELYNYLDEVSKELTNIVVDIGKRYAWELPSEMFSGKQTGGNITI